jgi:hypothetical protein
MLTGFCKAKKRLPSNSPVARTLMMRMVFLRDRAIFILVLLLPTTTTNLVVLIVI